MRQSEVKVDILGGRLQAHYTPGSGWLRVCGYGVSVKDTRGRELLFSDRHPSGAVVRLGPFILRALTPPARATHTYEVVPCGAGPSSGHRGIDGTHHQGRPAGFGCSICIADQRAATEKAIRERRRVPCGTWPSPDDRVAALRAQLALVVGPERAEELHAEIVGEAAGEDCPVSERTATAWGLEKAIKNHVANTERGKT